MRRRISSTVAQPLPSVILLVKAEFIFLYSIMVHYFSIRAGGGRCPLPAVLLCWLLAATGLCLVPACAETVRGNSRLESLAVARRLLLRQVYAGHRQTLYCGAAFSADRVVTPPPGFRSRSHRERARRLEWEHAVPAAQFGRTFTAWREGDSRCRRRDGIMFRGRSCAEKVSREFRRMQADMHNIFPAIGAVNAARADHAAAMLPDAASAFGSCAVKIARRKMEPPDAAKGTIARASLYMAAAYPRLRLSSEQEELFRAWDAAYPPGAWECERERRIHRLQGNGNPFVRRACAQLHKTAQSP